MSLSGRAGGERVRGRVLTGLESGGAVRLEAVAPFGAPFFILAGRNERATLVLPREHRVLKDTGVADVLERLTGLALGADDLRLIVSGAWSSSAAPTDGRQWGGGWQAVTIGPDRVAYLRIAERPAGVDRRRLRPVACRLLRHTPAASRACVRVRRAGDAAIDITARIEQLEVNTQINPRAWVVEIPSDADPMTLDELRSIAPLGREQSRPLALHAPGTDAIVSLPSFAKINLDLRVLGTRPDGYHDLRTIFQSLALFDNVTVTRAARAARGRPATSPTSRPISATWCGRRRRCCIASATGKTSAPRDIAIDLRKRVPSEAGLGGGSANAAMTLLALNKLWKLDLDLADADAALARGSAPTCRIFLVGGTALGLGRGDDIYPLADMPPVHVVILRPGFGVATRRRLHVVRRRVAARAKEPAPRAVPPGLAGLVGDAAQRSRGAGRPAPSRDRPHPPVAASTPARRLRRCPGPDRRYSACSSAPTRRGGPRTTWRGPAGCRFTPAR